MIGQGASGRLPLSSLQAEGLGCSRQKWVYRDALRAIPFYVSPSFIDMDRNEIPRSLSQRKDQLRSCDQAFELPAVNLDLHLVRIVGNSRDQVPAQTDVESKAEPIGDEQAIGRGCNGLVAVPREQLVYYRWRTDKIDISVRALSPCWKNAMDHRCERSDDQQVSGW